MRDSISHSNLTPAMRPALTTNTVPSHHKSTSTERPRIREIAGKNGAMDVRPATGGISVSSTHPMPNAGQRGQESALFEQFLTDERCARCPVANDSENEAAQNRLVTHTPSPKKCRTGSTPTRIGIGHRPEAASANATGQTQTAEIGIGQVVRRLNSTVEAGKANRYLSPHGRLVIARARR